MNAAEPHRRALVLACAQFIDDALPQLRSPRRDAKVLGATLADRVASRYDVVERVDITAHEARLAIEDFFATARPVDRHLLYISSHGVQDQRGELYFAFRDTQKDRPAATAVSAEWVNEQIRLSRSRTTIVLVDCCFSGAFMRGLRARDSGEANLGFLVRDLPPGTGVAVLTASGETEFSLEEAGGRAAAAARPSYFTEAVVAGISSGAADRDGDGRITVDELYDYVYRRVVDGPSPQRPRKMGLGEGEMVVAEVTTRVDEPPLPTAPAPVDATRLITPDEPLAPWPPIPDSAIRYRTVPPEAPASPAPVPVVAGRRVRLRRRWIGAAAVAVLVTASATAYATSQPSGEGNRAPAPVCGRAVAVLDVLTGSFADVSAAVRHGAELAVRENNAVHPDCPTTLAVPSGLSDIAERPDLLGVIPAALSEQLTELMPALDRAQLPVVSPIATGSDLTGHGWTTFFRTVAGNADQTDGDARYLTRVLNAQRVVVATEQTDLSTDIGVAMADRLDASAAVTTVSLRRGTTDVREPGREIADADPDAIYYTGNPELAGLLVRRLRRDGLTAPFVMAQSWPCRRDSPGLTSFTTALAGTPATGVSLTCTCLPNDEIAADFAARYRAAFGEDATGFAVTAYDITNLFLAGFRAGAGDRAAMLRHLRSYRGSGIAGRYQFSVDGDPDPATVGRWVTTDGQTAAIP